MVIYGLVALGFAGVLGSGLIPTEMPVELQWVLIGPIFVVGLAILVRGFVRLRWWLRARAAALTWTRSHGFDPARHPQFIPIPKDVSRTGEDFFHYECP